MPRLFQTTRRSASDREVRGHGTDLNLILAALHAATAAPVDVTERDCQLGNGNDKRTVRDAPAFRSDDDLSSSPTSGTAPR
jgi:hypothetical protein